MDAEKEHFIQEATRKLPEDPELSAAARHLLEEGVSGDNEVLREAVRSLRANGKSQFRRWWKPALYGIVTLISAAFVAGTVRMFWGFSEAISVMDGCSFRDVFHTLPQNPEALTANNLTCEQSLLLFGDLTKESRAERMKALWDRDPRNPSYFAEYVEAHLKEHGTLPEGFLHTARQIDPDNAWFTHIAAAARATDAVKARKQSEAARKANAPREWDVIDPVAMDEALAILEQALLQPRCENPRMALHRDQMKVLPMGTTTGVMLSLSHAVGKTVEVDIVLRHLADLLAAKAWLTGEAGDEEGFTRINRNTDHFLRQRNGTQVNTLIEELIIRVIASSTISSRAPAAAKLGMKAEAEALDLPLLEVTRLKKRISGPRAPNFNRKLLEDHGGRMAGITGFTSAQVENPPLLTAKDVEAGRLMDHATLLWTGAWVAWAVIIGGMTVCALMRFTGRKVIRHLSANMEILMRPRDWLAAGVPGVVFPVVYFLLVTRSTGLGGREYSMVRTDITIPHLEAKILLGMAQFMALSTTILLLSGWLACWRVARRLGPLGLETRLPWSLVVATLCAAAFIPVSGWGVTSSFPVMLGVAQGLTGVAVLGVVAFGVRCVSSSAPEMIRNQLAMRMLVPICAAAAIIPLCSLPFFKAEAFHWSAKDELVKPSREHMASSDFEHRMAMQLRKETRAILGYEP